MRVVAGDGHINVDGVSEGGGVCSCQEKPFGTNSKKYATEYLTASPVQHICWSFNEVCH